MYENRETPQATTLWFRFGKEIRLPSQGQGDSPYKCTPTRLEVIQVIIQVGGVRKCGDWAITPQLVAWSPEPSCVRFLPQTEPFPWNEVNASLPSLY